MQIDDDLLRSLKQQAHSQGTSLTKLINRVLRTGVQAARQAGKASRPYREKTFPMGEPRVSLVKALALASDLEDREVREELARRK